MDNQNQEPAAQPTQAPSPIPTLPQQVTTGAAAVNSIPQSANKPPLEISDDIAQSLLALNGIDTRPKAKMRLPIGMVLTITVLILLVIAASLLLGKANAPQNTPQTNSSTGSASVGTSNHSGSKTSDQQINQDVNSCSNIVNAVSEC